VSSQVEFGPKKIEHTRPIALNSYTRLIKYSQYTIGEFSYVSNKSD